jgi:hypothetical protein
VTTSILISQLLIGAHFSFQIEIKEWHRRQDDKIYGEYKPISEFKKYFQPVDYCASHCSEKANVHYGHDTVLHCSRHRSTMLRVKSE